jgi:hypothetical protein
MIRRAAQYLSVGSAGTWAAMALVAVVSATPAHAGGNCNKPPITISGPAGQSFRWDPGRG